jgi:hypothetical protein
MTKLWMVVLITDSLVIRLKVILVLSLHVIKEDIIILVNPGEVRPIVHFIERHFLQSSVIHEFVGFPFV